jgi:iron complex outermembrane recepter protein
MEQVRRNLVWLAVVLALAAPARAQTPTADMATIEGSVLDPDGKAIANAAVVVRNTLTGDVRATVSDAGGRFVIDLLTVGTYEAEASAPGFATSRRSGVQVSAGKPMSLTF